jgi:AcrR family transcriptional regulator
MFADQGIDSTSMDAIASAFRVSKATIYKHWPEKDKLALEVLSYLHGIDEEYCCLYPNLYPRYLLRRTFLREKVLVSDSGEWTRAISHQQV